LPSILCEFLRNVLNTRPVKNRTLSFLMFVLSLCFSAGPHCFASDAPESVDECAQFVKRLGQQHELVAMVEPLILEEVDRFHDYSRAVAARTLSGRLQESGSPKSLGRVANAPAPDLLLNFSCGLGAELCLENLVNAHLASAYYGKFSGQAYQKRLSGKTPAGGAVVAVLMPKATQEKLASFLESRKDLKKFPRIAVGNEAHPVGSALQSQVTTVKYQHMVFGVLPAIVPVHGVLELHLFGLLSRDTLADEVERLVGELAMRPETLSELRIHLYPHMHYLEGLRPQDSMARKIRNEEQRLDFIFSMTQHLSLESPHVTLQNVASPRIYGVAHQTSIKIEFIIEPVSLP
jgi:hypothetical protein